MSKDLFVDASALVAILREEADWPGIADRLDAAEQLHTSPIAMLETVMVVSSSMRLTPAEIEARLQQLLAAYEVHVLQVDSQTFAIAVQAFASYGKGRHPAKLNLGDCITYACAKQHRLELIYKGGDFTLTDLG